MKKFLSVCLFIFAFAFITSAATNDRPNVIVVLVDDMGWTDLGCFGSSFYETPNIDRLASQGMKFTQAYSACTVCSPTRASLLTGKYPARLHVTDWIAGHKRPFAKLLPPDWTMHLPGDELTIAQRLKNVGYATASIGKWHLGGEGFEPEKFGFDINIGGNNKGSPASYFSPYQNSALKDGPKGEFLSDRLTDEAIRFIEQNKANPFFIYLPHFAVHTPVQGKPDVVEKYRKKLSPGAQQNDPVYAALVESVDDSVGRLMQTLDELKLSERTIIIFTSDNGGLIGKTSNAPLRAGKGSVYEGGIRVPMIVRWPGQVKANTTNNSAVITMDLYPTVLDLVGLSPDPSHTVDGETLAPLLLQNGNLRRNTLHWHYPHYHPGGATPYGVIREGDFKLIQFFETGEFELYNIREDIGETRDLAKSNPGMVTALSDKLESWRRLIGAQMPMPNPNFDPALQNSREPKNEPQPKNKKKA